MLEDIIKRIKDEKVITVSYIQRNFSVGFNSAHKLFNELVEQSFINQDGKVIKKNIYKELGLEPKPEIKIIFLDVDGVLNCETTKDSVGPYVGIEDKKVSYLKEIVKETGAIIVLVSTWKEYWTNNPRFKEKQDELATYLDEKLAKQGLIAVDKTDDYNSFNRGDGILDYLSMKQRRGFDVSGFVIIDDEMFDYKQTKLTSHLIQTGYKEGLCKKHISKAIEKLNTI